MSEVEEQEEGSMEFGAKHLRQQIVHRPGLSAGDERPNRTLRKRNTKVASPPPFKRARNMEECEKYSTYRECAQGTVRVRRTS